MNCSFTDKSSHGISFNVDAHERRYRIALLHDVLKDIVSHMEEENAAGSDESIEMSIV